VLLQQPAPGITIASVLAGTTTGMEKDLKKGLCRKPHKGSKAL
jgi:hypothetical protein